MKKSFFAVAFISIALIQACSGSRDNSKKESDEEVAPSEEMRGMEDVQPSSEVDSVSTKDITINEEGVK